MIADTTDIIPPERLSQNKDDSQLYVIAWVNLVRDGKGRGTRVMSKAEAHALAQELNEDYPGIFHWAESIDAIDHLNHE